MLMLGLLGESLNLHQKQHKTSQIDILLTLPIPKYLLRKIMSRIEKVCLKHTLLGYFLRALKHFISSFLHRSSFCGKSVLIFVLGIYYSKKRGKEGKGSRRGDR